MSFRENIDGDDNVAIGYTALWYNTTGNRNVAIGYDALEDNINGNDNIAIGYEALKTTLRGVEISYRETALEINIEGYENML